ncbi:hypothetical protein E2C01_027133 [Portunus trituberculatus]|uniref:Uncharacterized protein n=1 Tax=Portunus trituberculatus TaxID=210409 RepID=A0A5B7EHC8_PORTR|nr:hypothetical protein [Portunus trituberculatus]
MGRRRWMNPTLCRICKCLYEEYTQRRTPYRAKQRHMENSLTHSRRSSPTQSHYSPPLGVFQGNCFGCGRPGDSRSQSLLQSQRKMEGKGLVSPPLQALSDKIVVGRILVLPGTEEACMLVTNLSTEPRQV